MTAVTSVACGVPATNDTADCVIAAAQGSNGSARRRITDQWQLGLHPLRSPGGASIQYFIGVACESPATGSAAPVLRSGRRPRTRHPDVPAGPAGTWNNETPTTLNGATVTGIPVEIDTGRLHQLEHPGRLQGDAGGQPHHSQRALSRSTGYSIAAGDCAAEGTTAPGATLTHCQAAPPRPRCPWHSFPSSWSDLRPAGERRHCHAHGHITVQHGCLQPAGDRRHRRDHDLGPLWDLHVHGDTSAAVANGTPPSPSLWAPTIGQQRAGRRHLLATPDRAAGGMISSLRKRFRRRSGRLGHDAGRGH